MNLLIADSGSTKTAWCLVNDESGPFQDCSTSGVNPLYQDEESMLRILQKEYAIASREIDHIYFYGAGCINDNAKDLVKKVMIRFFRCKAVTVYTDLMAAARSLCQDHEGIACILGTGSNSCYYDGKVIVRQVSPLGYVLGDEGSGAVIGKKFLADLLKKQLPPDISERFFSVYNITPDQVLENIYKKPFPSRYLAQFTKFIRDNLQEDCLQKLVKTSFREFFDRNIRQYPEAKRYPLQFTGGIAFHFKDLLQESAQESGFHTGDITLSPMEGLINYHLRFTNT